MEKSAVDIGRLIGNQIYKYRCAHPVNNNLLPMKDVARQLGVSRFTLNSWLNGSSIPSMTNILAIADLLGISIDELAGRTTQH